MKLEDYRHEIGKKLFCVYTFINMNFAQFHANSILTNFMLISFQFSANFVPISYFVPKPVFATLHFKALKSRLMKLGGGRHEIGLMYEIGMSFFISSFFDQFRA